MSIQRVITKQELLIRRIHRLIQQENFKELKKILRDNRPEDIAACLAGLDDEEKLSVFILLPAGTAGNVLNETDLVSEAYLIKNISDEKLASILSLLPDDEAVDILEQMEEERRDLLLSKVKESSGIERLMHYDSKSAGGIMATQFIAVTQEDTVKSVLGRIRRFKADDPDLYHVIYVIDEEQQLLGFVTLPALLKSNPQKKIKNIFNRNPIRVQPSVDQEEVARLVSMYNLINLPVVDEGNRLIGVVYVEDVIDVINDEATEDFYKFAGINEEDQTDSRSVLHNSRVRLPWLLTTLAGSLLASMIITSFQVTLEKIMALAAFMPVITAMSGNVGVQSSSVVIRGLATGSIALQSLGRVIFREFRIGMTIGGISGLMLGVIVHFWKSSVSIIDIGLAVGAALFCAMTVAATIGSLIPFLLEKMNIDPAIATGPFVTTFNDITGLIIYFLTASSLLKFAA